MGTAFATIMAAIGLYCLADPSTRGIAGVFFSVALCVGVLELARIRRHR